MTANRTTVGVSLKMYFDLDRATRWLTDVADVANAHPGLRADNLEVFVAPSFVALPTANEILKRTAVQLCAQDVAAADLGAFTGEVSARELAEVGCSFVEVGHAERRLLFGETDLAVAAKTASALRNGLTPVVCVGESQFGPADIAAEECAEQLHAALASAPSGRVVVAYEPVWAIGASTPAPVSHIATVTERLRREVSSRDGEASSVIYGGSAGVGLLSALGDAVDGLFLGRFAHDIEALTNILDEATRAAGIER